MKEERLKVLQMLSENKISAEEAAKLLSALSAPTPEQAPRKPEAPQSPRTHMHGNPHINVDEETLRTLGKNLGKTSQQVGQKISQEFNKVMADEELRDAGRKIGSRMRDLGTIIRGEVRQAMEEVRREIAENKQKGVNVSEDVKQAVDQAYENIVHADKMVKQVMQDKIQETSNIEEAMDELRDAMEEVTDGIKDLQDEWKNWTEDTSEKSREDSEEFIQQIRENMAEVSAKMAEVAELSLAMEQLQKSEKEVRYVNELINWAKQGNKKADDFLSQLELNLSEVQALLLSQPDDLTVDF